MGFGRFSVVNAAIQPLPASRPLARSNRSGVGRGSASRAGWHHFAPPLWSRGPRPTTGLRLRTPPEAPRRGGGWAREMAPRGNARSISQHNPITFAFAFMAPKRIQLQPESAPELVSDSEDSEDFIDQEDEEYAIRFQYEEYKKAMRIAKDLKHRSSPVSLKHFADEAWQEGFSRSAWSIYMMYRRAVEQEAADPIPPKGRPSKKPNDLQLHTFATVAAANTKAGKTALTPQTLAVFDKFIADQKCDPREHTLSGTKLKDFVEEVKEKEPWLTTTRAICTSADRMDGTAANIMEAYYTSIDDLHNQYEVFDLEPTRTLNFDECGLNNRGEYEQESKTVFTAVDWLKKLKGRTPHRTLALNDGSGNVSMVPFILGGNILLATAFIGPIDKVSLIHCTIECNCEINVFEMSFVVAGQERLEWSFEMD